MTEIRIEIDTSGADIALADLLQRGDDLSPLMADLSEYLLTSTRDRFNTEEDPQGMPWEPLAPATVKRKQRLAFLGDGGQVDEGILKQRGILFDTMGTEFDPRSASVGSELVYAATHQFGDSSRGIPAREYLGLSVEDEAEVVLATEDYLRRAVL